MYWGEDAVKKSLGSNHQWLETMYSVIIFAGYRAQRQWEANSEIDSEYSFPKVLRTAVFYYSRRVIYLHIKWLVNLKMIPHHL